jgi:hypothetical protein
MERELFDWDEWDIHGTFCFSFSNVTTKVNLPGVPKGSTFEVAVIDYETGKLTFENEGQQAIDVQLVLHAAE